MAVVFALRLVFVLWARFSMLLSAASVSLCGLLVLVSLASALLLRALLHTVILLCRAPT